MTVVWFPSKESLMKNAQMKQGVPFEDLPLFRGFQHRQIWESLPLHAWKKAVRLLGDLLLVHIASSQQKGGKSHE